MNECIPNLSSFLSKLLFDIHSVASKEANIINLTVEDDGVDVIKLCLQFEFQLFLIPAMGVRTNFSFFNYEDYIGYSILRTKYEGEEIKCF
jgi:hypothetical protein